jgi:hypothetical protein
MGPAGDDGQRSACGLVTCPTAAPPPHRRPRALEVGQHHGLTGIVARSRQRGDLPTADALAFAIGLRRFSKVMLQPHGLPLPADFAPHVKAFMPRVKLHDPPGVQ